MKSLAVQFVPVNLTQDEVKNLSENVVREYVSKLELQAKINEAKVVEPAAPTLRDSLTQFSNEIKALVDGLDSLRVGTMSTAAAGADTLRHQSISIIPFWNKTLLRRTRKIQEERLEKFIAVRMPEAELLDVH